MTSEQIRKFMEGLTFEQLIDQLTLAYSRRNIPVYNLVRRLIIERYGRGKTSER